MVGRHSEEVILDGRGLNVRLLIRLLREEVILSKLVKLLVSGLLLLLMCLDRCFGLLMGDAAG